MIWTRPGPVQANLGMEIGATTSFADAPRLDLLLVPGGPGQTSLMRHSLLLDYIRSCAEGGAWMVGVSTGALLLAQAGLLKGRRATTHWLATEALAAHGVQVCSKRWVIDERVATSAGVSAGIDLALELARSIAGERVAQSIQLQIEYDPDPPLRAGSPDTAPEDIVRELRANSRHYR